MNPYLATSFPPPPPLTQSFNHSVIQSLTLLHTSDWHLGHRLYNNERLDEQQLALDWLLETMTTEAVDVLIVAGDVFDLGNPPNYARRMYYDFLERVGQTSCRHVSDHGGQP